ncbi:OPT oligopeptide transporter protein-domain-containing protein [Russula earlei]|uniref:OPT oligopeptide transporter protein-domain-containing protein n=1 Tax=Russula earlei TaxID=71964 RepID=A0ACC0TXJ9_9AGAM|nr:OPT oligopeptide transporter protein-domain-containing protein [Russula earlei]
MATVDLILESQPSLRKQGPDVSDILSKEDHDILVKELSDCDITDVLRNERDLVTHVIPVDDDPSLSPYTFRSIFIGTGLAAFGGAIAEMDYFKPQTIVFKTMVLAISSYMLGVSMQVVIPRSGWFRYLNPCPFNKKENAFIVIMASAGATSAMATEVIAIQSLFYKIVPNKVASLFLVTSNQFLGYFIAGLMTPILVYPSKMLYPSVLPVVSTLGAFHESRANKFTNHKQRRLFYIAVLAIFTWELFPEWIFPLLTGFSVFCLANPTSPDFTHLFGGTNGNEGLGFLSLSFDWQYISATWNPFAIPLRTQVSALIGYFFCIITLLAVYYNDFWSSKNLPFLSQDLFYENGTLYNQTLILNDKHEIDPTLLANQGLPYYAATWVASFLAVNMGLAATFTHLLLWNRDDLRLAWSWMSRDSLKKMQDGFNWRFWKPGKREAPADADIDPHYREMLKYREVPNAIYVISLLECFILAAAFLYKGSTMLPWWGLLVSVLLAAVFLLFFGALSAMTGITLITKPLAQVIGGLLLPGKPIANMFFVLFCHNSVNQGELYLRNLKIAQYTKLSPMAAFVAQLSGTFIGTNLNSVMSKSILTHQAATLLSVDGTDIWSGQKLRQFNWESIVLGGLGHELFTSGKRYQWVLWASGLGFLVPIPFWIIHRYYPKLRADYLYTPIILWFMGILGSGINSPLTMYFAVAWISQWFLRTRHPRWFARYNYILGGALDGGSAIMVSILGLIVGGLVGMSHPFPQWWGANQKGNYDRCVKTPS